MDTDDLRIRRWGLVGDGYLGPAFHMRFKPGHVLYGSRRTYLRKVAVADFEGVTANTTFVIESKDSKVLLPELLPFIMQTEAFHEHSIKQSKGSVNPYVNFSDLTWYEFTLPPLEEQRRISGMLGAVETLIERLESLSQSLCVSGLSFMESALLTASHGAATRVGDLLREPPRNGVSPSANSDAEGLRTVSISAIRDGLFDPHGCVKHARIDPGAARPFFVQRGDVFVIRGNGNRQLCGKAGLSDTSYDDLFYPDLLIRLRFDLNKMLPGFAVAQWNLPGVHGQLSARAKSSNGIWKVNGQDIREHRLFAPAVAEQRKVLEEFSFLQAGVTDARGREAAARDFKAAVLNSLWGDS